MMLKANWKSTGFYGEHPESVDWIQRSMDACSGMIPTYREFGSVKSIRTVSEYTEKTERMCPTCGGNLGLFHGFKNCQPEPVIYNRRSTIGCMKEDVRTIEEYWNRKGEGFLDSGFIQLDFAMSVPLCGTPETKGVQSFDPSSTVERRRENRDKCLVYLPSKHDQGLDPCFVTRSEALKLRGGIIP